MKKTYPLLLLSLLISGCISPFKSASDFNEGIREVFAPAYSASVLTNGSLDVIYCSYSFFGKNERWPTNASELRTFVDQSDGYLWLQQFERFDLSKRTNDTLAIYYVRMDHTNEVHMTLNKPTRNN